MNLKLRSAQPCKECPWRRKHPAGWLGGLGVEWFLDLARWQQPIACHKTVSDKAPSVPALCAGYAIFLNNSCSRPKDAALAAEVDKVGQSPAIFQWPYEFFEHHDSFKGAKR
jgi:hypothetical protein